jgi:putative ABC transport system substrate-binding protein
LNMEVTPKRPELLHELLPKATAVALLVNPANAVVAEAETRAVQTAARTLGLQLHILQASTEAEVDSAVASLAQLRAGGLVISTGDAFFNSESAYLAAVTVRNAVPAIYQGRDFVAAGGLVGYGGSVVDSYHLAGIYAGRILTGEKPADLPVLQSTKVEMFINLKTAKALDITIPLPLSGRADELIE